MIRVHATLRNTPKQTTAMKVADGVMKVRRNQGWQRNYGVTFSHIGKLNPIDLDHVNDLAQCLAFLAQQVSSCSTPIILGLAESGIVPSFAMFQACLNEGRSAKWFCTSRFPISDVTFTEPHSHAPTHFLPPAMISAPIDEVWIVEDEITTGKTLNNLLVCLRSHVCIRHVRIFSLLDTREAKAIEQSVRDWNADGMMVSQESLLSTNPDFWKDDVQQEKRTKIDTGIRDLYTGESIVTGLHRLITGEISRIQHVTLSPWAIDGVHVLTRKEHSPGYYLYNREELFE